MENSLKYSGTYILSKFVADDILKIVFSTFQRNLDLTFYDSHEMSNRIFSEKKIKLSAAVAVISAIRFNKIENDAFYHICYKALHLRYWPSVLFHYYHS